MIINTERLVALLLGLAAGLSPLPALANTEILLFDTPASGFAEVETAYGLAKDGFVQDAQVVDGQLRLYGTGGGNGNLVFAAAPGDLSFHFLADIGGPNLTVAGNVNVGFTTGHQVFYIHPGYWDQYFVPGLGLSGSLGFTPDLSLPTHFSVDIAAATGLVSVIVQNGQQHFFTSFTDVSYKPGLSRPGLTVGSMPGYWAVYDELVISTVPEPATWGLWCLGLLAIGWRGGRRGLRTLGRRAACIGAAGAAAMLPAAASVLVLHDEALDGDLSNQGYSIAADQRLITLSAGISSISGEVANVYTGLALSRDVDAFQLLVPVGLRVTGVDLSYSLGSTLAGVSSYAMNLWRKDSTQPGTIAEYINYPRSGSQALFDAGGPFQPVDGNGQAGVFWLQLQDNGGVAGTRHSYAYTLSFQVEAEPAPLSEPGSVGLSLAALGAAGSIRLSVNRRRGAPGVAGRRRAWLAAPARPVSS